MTVKIQKNYLNCSLKFVLVLILKIKQYMIEFEAKCFNTIFSIVLERLSNVHVLPHSELR
jgi:hypothetical protein